MPKHPTYVTLIDFPKAARGTEILPKVSGYYNILQLVHQEGSFCVDQTYMDSYPTFFQRVKPARLRAGAKKSYYTIDLGMDGETFEVNSMEENGSNFDDWRHRSDNYFLYEDSAKQVADALNQTFESEIEKIHEGKE